MSKPIFNFITKSVDGFYFGKKIHSKVNYTNLVTASTDKLRIANGEQITNNVVTKHLPPNFFTDKEVRAYFAKQRKGNIFNNPRQEGRIFVSKKDEFNADEKLDDGKLCLTTWWNNSSGSGCKRVIVDENIESVKAGVKELLSFPKLLKNFKPRKVEYKNGKKIVTSYAEPNEIIGKEVITTRNGKEFTYSYDSKNNLQSVKVCTKDGRLVSKNISNGNIFERHYDDITIKKDYEEMNNRFFESNNEIETVLDEYEHPHQIIKDNQNRIIFCYDPRGTIQELTYNKEGLVTKVQAICIENNSPIYSASTIYKTPKKIDVKTIINYRLS